MQKSIKGYPLLFGYLGIFIILTGIFNLIPLLMLFAFPNEVIHWWKFAIPGVSAIIIGFLLTLILKGKKVERMQRFEDAVFLVVMWATSILISSVPFLLNGYSFIRSLFEVTSGLSTTGATTFEAHTLPSIYIFYRSILLFFGGVGLVLVITSTVSDRYGMRLYSAEGHNDKLMSNLAKSARLILSIYAGYITIGTIMYVIFGMPWFDAINHSIAAVATGGFSTETQSIGAYRTLVGHAESIGIEVVSIILMLLGATSFLIHAFLFRGEIKKALKHNEFNLFLVVFVIFMTAMVINLNTWGGESLEISFRDSIFQFTSAITTSGLQTVASVNALPSLFKVLMILLMIIGGQLGSTAGALKQGRVALAFKSSFWYFRDKMSHTRTVRSNFILRNGKYEIVSDLEIRHNYAFIIIYGLILLTGSFVFMSFGHGFENSLFEFASLLGGVGFSVGIISPTAPDLILWTGMAGMFIGRLEFTVIVVALMKLFLDIRRKEIL